MIASIATYHVGPHPIIKKLDEMGGITPAGHSKTLLDMITDFQIMFVIAAIAGVSTLQNSDSDTFAVRKETNTYPEVLHATTG